MTYLKNKNFFFIFHSDFGCLEGGGGEHPPCHLTYIFNPVPNRVKERQILIQIENNATIKGKNIEQGKGLA